MKKTVAYICLIWILLGSLYYSSGGSSIFRFFGEINHGIEELLEDILPFGGMNSFQLINIILWFLVISAVFGSSGHAISLLNLKKHSISEDGKLFKTESKSQSNAKVLCDDYIQDICYIDRQFNTWAKIILIELLILAPGVYIAATVESVYVLIPFLIFAVILLFILLRGRITLGFADSSATGFLTNKIKAGEVITSLLPADSVAFHHVSLSGFFSERDLYLHKHQITGIVTQSKFPWLLFLLFLISAIAALRFIGDSPGGLIAPIILIVIVIILSRKRTLARLIGGHYLPLGVLDNTETLIASINEGK